MLGVKVSRFRTATTVALVNLVMARTVSHESEENSWRVVCRLQIVVRWCVCCVGGGAGLCGRWWISGTRNRYRNNNKWDIVCLHTGHNGFEHKPGIYIQLHIKTAGLVCLIPACRRNTQMGSRWAALADRHSYHLSKAITIRGGYSTMSI